MIDLKKLCLEVEAEYGMGGLSSGLYADFASDVAKRAIKMEREACQKICEEHASDDNPPYKAYEDTYMDGWLDASNECGWAIRARTDRGY